jgi:hypothetical protein
MTDFIDEAREAYLDGLAEACREHNRLVEDAERWRALMASQRIRIMGAAGWVLNSDGTRTRKNGPMHLGLELWSEHPAVHPSAEYPQGHCRALLVTYVDEIRQAMREQLGEPTP